MIDSIAQHVQTPFLSIVCSQNTNNYIYTDTESKRVYISSVDGLNIYDGQHVRVYRPSTHNMYGYNIQSPFYEDTSGKVWFTTYEALHYYDPAQDDFQYFFMQSASGDTLKENYKAFHQDQNLLYLKAGTHVFIYDVNRMTIFAQYPINFSDVFEMTVVKNSDATLVFGGNERGYAVYELLSENRINPLYKSDLDVRSVCSAREQRLWLGHGNGDLSLFNPYSNEILFQTNLTNTPINGIMTYGDTRLFVSVSDDHLLVFDAESKSVTERIYPIDAQTKNHVNSTFPPVLDRDSTLWFGCDGYGVFFANLNKQKFKHFLKSSPEQQPVSVTKILQGPENDFIILTRKHGIILMDRDGTVRYQIRDIPNGRKDFTAITGVMVSDDQLLFCAYNILYTLSISTGEISVISPDPDLPELDFAQLERLLNGKIIASCYASGLIELRLMHNRYSYKPYSDISDYSKMTTYFKADLQGNLYVGNDEVDLLVLRPTPDNESHAYAYTLPLAGIRSLVDDPDHHRIFITNSQGIYVLDLTTRMSKQIKDPHQLLLQSIYSGLMDTRGDIWLGTNKGLLKYYPANEEVKVFSEMDGVQAPEFNSHVYLQTDEGYMLFGGVNGINYFHPDKVRFSEKTAPIYISEVLINDEPDTFYRVPQYHYTYDLPYGRNTISFEFHAIDYADPNATRVRYKLSGIDDDYVESKTAQGFTRYANLSPGQYTLSLIGRNSDGNWNPVAREIKINIRPPFWLSWWFISLSVLSVAALSYWAIRSHFQRKLARKNQLLREQSLIIEKQQAIERERTRIASEMHDDLGSGLTTIRYLSDKALRQAKDAEEAKQIERIAEHSNALVRNMSEIIWAMNSRFDNAENLIGYLRRYASEFLDEHQMPLTFTAENENLNTISIGGEKRRNIFLVFKEILHNSIKYSGASGIKINIQVREDLEIHISEIEGKGFDPDDLLEKGNGLFNCRKRMATIQGQINFKRTDEAMHIILTVPLK